MLLKLSLVVLTCLRAEIPTDVTIPLIRSSDDKWCIRGTIEFPLQRSHVCAPIKSSECGGFDVYDLFRLQVPGTSHGPLPLDVSDMTRIGESDFELQGVCLGFQSTLAHRLNSVIYQNQDEVGTQVILNAVDPFQYAIAGEIVYANLTSPLARYGSTLVASDGIDTNAYHFTNVSIVLNDESPSTISDSTHARLVEIIASNGGALLHSSVAGSILRADNCYDRFISLLPNIHYMIANDVDGTMVIVADLVFTPEDYMERTPSGSLCRIRLHRNISGHYLRLTDHLLRKIGGIHFDYANGRIGFFDPL